MRMNNKLIPFLIASNVLATGVLGMSLVDDIEHTKQTKMYNNTEEVFTVDHYNPEHKYVRNIRVTGEEVVNLINVANEIGLAIFVNTKDNPAYLSAYGRNLGDGRENKYLATDIYTGGNLDRLNLNSYADYSNEEVYVKFKNVVDAQREVDYSNLAHPLLKSYRALTMLETEHTVGEPVYKPLDTSYIKADSRFISVGILNKDLEIIGYVFEEYGMDADKAFLANGLYLNEYLADLDDYTFTN